MKNFFMTAFICVAASPLCFAGSAVPQKIVGGDASAGKAKTAVCAACHGADGNSVIASFPKLAGQNEKYLEKQLKDIQSGERAVAEMTGLLANASEQDLKDMSAYYASKVSSGGAANPDVVELGQKIYRGGVQVKGITACTGCHSPTGQGNAPAGFPALAGQHSEYIVKQLKLFREGADYIDRGRRNDGEARTMRAIAAKMSDKEIEAVSSYISGLH